MRSRLSVGHGGWRATLRRRWSSLPALLACALLAAPSIATEESNDGSIIFFKNGRALRVAAYRVEGDWAYLTVSQRADPEEEPSELIVRRDSIERLKEDTATNSHYAVKKRWIPPTGFGLANHYAGCAGTWPWVVFV